MMSHKGCNGTMIRLPSTEKFIKIYTCHKCGYTSRTYRKKPKEEKK